jgi:hypothetical protein
VAQKNQRHDDDNNPSFRFSTFNRSALATTFNAIVLSDGMGDHPSTGDGGQHGT